MKEKPKIIVFSSGTKDGGGSGFENLVVQGRENSDVNYEIVAVVSNHENGGVKERADKLGVPFIHFEKPFTAERYQEIVESSGASLVALSGWLKLVSGLDPKSTINIHPGNPETYGGDGMYGDHVHKAVLENKEEYTQVAMHFVTPVYDEGPIFFRMPVEVKSDDTVDTLRARVNQAEHKYQPLITSMVANSEISWDGKDAGTLKAPEGYEWL
jgi:phosphoribosylglycinamide formyltransferase-1